MLFTWIVALCLAPYAAATHQGMIAYFDGPCPEGWHEYQDLIGRVPVGAGCYLDVTADGRAEKVTYDLQDKGGEVTHLLTVEEMPAHNHTRNPFGKDEEVINYDHSSNFGMCCHNGRSTLRIIGHTGVTGGNKPHSNMPPYLVLHACQKVVSDSYISRNEFLELTHNIASCYATQHDFATLKKEIATLKRDHIYKGDAQLLGFLASVGSSLVSVAVYYYCSSYERCCQQRIVLVPQEGYQDYRLLYSARDGDGSHYPSYQAKMPRKMGQEAIM